MSIPKLTPDDVTQIRMSSLPDRHFAQLLGVSEETVRSARVGHTHAKHPVPPQGVSRPSVNMKTIIVPEIRVVVTLRNQMVTADASALIDGLLVKLKVRLQDAQGRPLDWTLSREELVVVARAAQAKTQPA